MLLASACSKIKGKSDELLFLKNNMSCYFYESGLKLPFMNISADISTLRFERAILCFNLPSLNCSLMSLEMMRQVVLPPAWNHRVQRWTSNPNGSWLDSWKRHGRVEWLVPRILEGVVPRSLEGAVPRRLDEVVLPSLEEAVPRSLEESVPSLLRWLWPQNDLPTNKANAQKMPKC